jgi:hypothetical protein
VRGKCRTAWCCYKYIVHHGVLVLRYR